MSIPNALLLICFRDPQPPTAEPSPVRCFTVKSPTVPVFVALGSAELAAAPQTARWR